ncbi:flippase-like domain-containing protein [Candidatus Bathyarchaeota archaeon]|nr:flippase-like domain-containing protein [Candidatus Bathyarchaeota archaeon]
MNLNKKLALMIQLIFGVLIILALVWYINAKNLFFVLSKANYVFLSLALLAYFLMNLIFAYRIKYVIRSLGRNLSFFKALMAQYGGMLASDFTPARSGYLTVPLILNADGVPIEAGFSCILGCQSIEFLIKMIGGLMAAFYLASKVYLAKELLALSILGIALMFLGGLAIALSMWSKRLYGVIKAFSCKPLIGKIISYLLSKTLSFQSEAEKFKSAIPIVAVLTLISWIIKGLEWFFIGLALSIKQLSFLDFFLLHPLITALSFVPLTPSGLGFQEGAAVGILYLLGFSMDSALAFAILARFLLILEDVLGVFPLTKVGAKIFESSKKY